MDANIYHPVTDSQLSNYKQIRIIILKLLQDDIGEVSILTHTIGETPWRDSILQIQNPSQYCEANHLKTVETEEYSYV